MGLLPGCVACLALDTLAFYVKRKVPDAENETLDSIATMTNRRRRKDRRITQSGAVGGPSTGSGLNFQVDLAIRHTLDAISQALAAPVGNFQISMEPRIVAGAKNVTCWDIRRSDPERVTEVKLRPNRTDIEEWLDRVNRGARHNDSVRFELTYGRGASSLIRAIENLCRIAKEAAGCADKFQALVALEHNADIDAVLAHLTEEPHTSLLRVYARPIDPESLKEEIHFRLQYLVREQDRTRLYESLVATFHEGIQQRATYRVRDLIQETLHAQIELFAPPPSLPRQVPPIVSSAVYILQYCESALPGEVLAAGIECTKKEVNESLSPYLRSGGLSEHDGCWTVGEIRPVIVQENGLRLVAKALRQLLEFIRAYKRSARGWRQIANAVALAKVCQSEDSDLVSCPNGS